MKWDIRFALHDDSSDDTWQTNAEHIEGALYNAVAVLESLHPGNYTITGINRKDR